METGNQFSIMVVDDEETLRISLAYALRKEGYRVIQHADGTSAWAELRKNRPDILLLDIMMPGLDGIELCRRVRAVDKEVGIIFLTSRDGEYERVMGLEIGGDDYLCKPFSLRELIARVGVQARRRGEPGGERRREESIELGPLLIDRREFRARFDGHDLELTATEFRLLWTLAGDPGRAWPRDELIRRAYQEQTYVEARTLDTHIKRLRAKLEAGGCSRDAIETVYSVGYRLHGLQGSN